ncbi:MAG: family 78 glycoside hydrolase catalytic domain [Kiritimatiellae bacterium]|nr:family 78 glycoside hydrolase catalytic domain [Kiritimatiellia bacterium]MDD5519836.1 family 78 glycoside hydrolase catalytic domain [Kiritimatiellia bacterium]
MKKLMIMVVLGLLWTDGTQAGFWKSDKIEPARLTCEYLENPFGIGAEKPRLAWIIGAQSSRGTKAQSANLRGIRQIAYQILVASSEKLLKKDQGDIWDSGKMESDQSIQVEYAGKPLKSCQRYYWKVRVWTTRDSGYQASDSKVSAWSKPACWGMGLLEAGDWQAKWIKFPTNETSPWVRKEFSLAAVPDRAIAFVNVLGYYELYINGKKMGDDVLSPAVSELPRRSLYRCHDISEFLRSGDNCIGLWLGKGWARSGIVARVQLNMTVEGRGVVIGTDRTWTCSPSTHTLLGGWKWGDFGGERVDARREIAGWSKVGCKAGEWTSVEETAAPGAVVTAQSCPPNRIGRVIPLATCIAMGTNTWELDFGTNLSGWLRLRLPRMKSGQQVVMHYADKRFQTPEGDKTPAGNIGTTALWKLKTATGDVAYQTFKHIDEFISAGKKGEQFCSKFNYHGFRYVIVEGLPAQPAPGDAEALLIESDLETAGDFACSNDLFNRIYQIGLWTLRCLSLGGYMVDCPHRERLGYGDGQVGIESLIMSRNVAAFYGKWATDWQDAQNPSTGDFSHTAPSSNGGGGPAWGGTGCVLPCKLYLYYGDRRLLDHAYEPIRRYTEYLESRCSNNILRAYGGKWDFIGDWVPPGRGMDTTNWPAKPSAELFNNCYRVYLMEQLARAADILNRTDEAQRLRTRIGEIRPLIHAAFYDASKQLYVLDEQAYQLMPLMTGVVPDDLHGTIFKKLEDLIQVKNKGHLDTGMIGTYFLLQYLQEIGRDDLLYIIMNQTTYPGWGYMLSQGATTFWEQWNGYYSQIHSCFNSPGGWFQQGLAGIRPDVTGPGFKKIIIKPAIVGGLTWVKCSYDSIHGRIVSNWKLENGKLKMDIIIPPNTTATVYVPAKDAGNVTESGKSAAKAKGVKFLRIENSVAVYEIGSGCYQFVKE